VSNTTACGTGSAVIVIAQYTIDASFTASPSSGTAPLTVSFNNTSTGASAFGWDFNNGHVSGVQNPGPETYQQPGTYTVVLTATNSNCTVYDTVLVHVLETGATLTIPNVFTPNQDHVNDVFYVTGTNIKDFTCYIYDRWGLLLYTISDIKGGWDGKVGGQNSTDGTYFYLIQATDVFDKSVEEKGHFLLIR
jgi:gliding motility-associated-like protein